MSLIPFSYAGGLGDLADEIAKLVPQSTKRFIDVLAGGCRLPYIFASQGTPITLNDANYYAYVNANSLFCEIGGVARPELDAMSWSNGWLTKHRFGYWNGEFRQVIDGVVKTAWEDPAYYGQKSTLLAAVTRALLSSGSYRNLSWSDVTADGRKVFELTPSDAKDYLADSLQTIYKKRRYNENHAVTCMDFRDFLGLDEFRPDDVVFVDAPWPRETHDVSNPYNFYDEMNEVITYPIVGDRDLDEKVPDVSWDDVDLFGYAEDLLDGIARALEDEATVIMIKQTISNPPNDWFESRFGKSIVKHVEYPLRGRKGSSRKEFEGHEDVWVLRV